MQTPSAKFVSAQHSAHSRQKKPRKKTLESYKSQSSDELFRTEITTCEVFCLFLSSVWHILIRMLSPVSGCPLWWKMKLQQLLINYLFINNLKTYRHIREMFFGGVFSHINEREKTVMKGPGWMFCYMGNMLISINCNAIILFVCFS